MTIFTINTDNVKENITLISELVKSDSGINQLDIEKLSQFLIENHFEDITNNSIKIDERSGARFIDEDYQDSILDSVEENWKSLKK